MEAKNTTTITIIAALVTGIFLGYLIWGTCGMGRLGSGMHMMSNGMMMQNRSMMGGMMDMDDMMSSMTAGLAGKTGSAFDRAFLSEMIVHHEGAVEMAELVLKTSDRPELIKLANDIISAQTREIATMKGWQKAWFNQ